MDPRGLTIALACLGAACSLAASAVRRSGGLADGPARWLNLAGYGLCALSLGLFVMRGLWA
ncbi:MAG: hypothetical protein LDL07_01055 [Desulfarculus sp.]|nr:hypothetical protein [Desulfarculus sp.]